MLELAGQVAYLTITSTIGALIFLMLIAAGLPIQDYVQRKVGGLEYGWAICFGHIILHFMFVLFVFMYVATLIGEGII